MTFIEGAINIEETYSSPRFPFALKDPSEKATRHEKIRLASPSHERILPNLARVDRQLLWYRRTILTPNLLFWYISSSSSAFKSVLKLNMGQEAPYISTYQVYNSFKPPPKRQSWGRYAPVSTSCRRSPPQAPSFQGQSASHQGKALAEHVQKLRVNMNYLVKVKGPGHPIPINKRGICSPSSRPFYQ